MTILVYELSASSTTCLKHGQTKGFGGFSCGATAWMESVLVLGWMREVELLLPKSGLCHPCSSLDSRGTDLLRV